MVRVLSELGRMQYFPLKLMPALCARLSRLILEKRELSFRQERAVWLRSLQKGERDCAQAELKVLRKRNSTLR